MISCAALQICNFRRGNPSSAINVTNIPGGSEKCGGLTHVIRWPPLRAREVLRPTEQQGPHFLHTPYSFPLGTQRLHRRWCSLQAAAGEPYSKRAQTFITNCRVHVMTPCQVPRISGIIRFSEDLNGWIGHGTEVILLPSRWLGLPLPRLQKAYACRKDIT